MPAGYSSDLRERVVVAAAPVSSLLAAGGAGAGGAGGGVRGHRTARMQPPGQVLQMPAHRRLR